MEEGLHGILIGVAMIAFVLAMTFAKDVVHTGEGVLVRAGERTINQRSVVILEQRERDGG